MIAQEKDQELARCRVLIEAKLGWGSGENWSNQDFEQLSAQLARETGVTLSGTTLKRVWGRVKYDSAPTTTTLNALVAFLGYENWRHFQNIQQPKAGPPVIVPRSEAERAPAFSEDLTRTSAAALPSEKPTKSHQWKLAAALVAGLISIVAFIQTAPKPLSGSDFSFASRHVTKGIPNSVIFDYDASASPTDSVYIQQSWDPQRRQLVPKTGRQHTSIYYYPGYFRAKLVVGQQIVKEHDLFIPSEGWHVAVMKKPVPVYFKATDVTRDGRLHLPVDAIQKQNITMQPDVPMVQYRYVRDFTGLMTHNFTFETRVKNNYQEGSAACQKTSLMILCKNDMLSIPLSAKGCVGNLNMFLAGHEVTSATTDLSGLGADMGKWVDVRLEVKNKHARVLVNGKKAYETTLPNEPASIVGLSYYFEGTGSVDFARFLSPDGKPVFEDHFDEVLASK